MKAEHGKIEGNVIVNEEWSLFGMVTGNISIQTGGQLYLHGMCCENVVLYEGSRVFIYGIVTGNVYNRGGYLEVYGMIIGNLHDEEGKTYVDNKAIIHGKTHG